MQFILFVDVELAPLLWFPNTTIFGTALIVFKEKGQKMGCSIVAMYILALHALAIYRSIVSSSQILSGIVAD